MSWFDGRDFNGAQIKVSLAQRNNSWQNKGGPKKFGGPGGGGGFGDRSGGGGGGFGDRSGGGGGGRFNDRGGNDRGK